MRVRIIYSTYCMQISLYQLYFVYKLCILYKYGIYMVYTVDIVYKRYKIYTRILYSIQSSSTLGTQLI